MSELSAVVTNWRPLWHFFTQIGCWRKFKPRMHVLAGLPIRTEAGQIIFTQNSSNVPVSASRSVSAEASVVPRAVLDLAFWIDVQKCALLFMTSVESRVEVALRHLCHVVLVQELTAVAFFTKSS